jgi:hypothetical protein
MARHHREREIKDADVQCYTVAIDRHRQSMISSHFARWFGPGCLDACSYLGAKYLRIGPPFRGALRRCWNFWLWRRAVNRDRGGAIAPLALFGVKADIPPCSS